MQRIGFLLLPGLGLSSLAGALESLSAVNLLLDAPAYEPLLLSVAGGGVAASSGATLLTLPMSQVPALDAVFVVSERPWATDDPLGPVVLPWLQQQAERGIWMAGIGSGAAWLAEAGLLKGLRCTVDWVAIAALAERHEDVLVSQQLYEIEPQRLSCAGQQASLDMMIAWLTERHGPRIGQSLLAQLGLERLRGRDERQRVPSQLPQGGGSPKLAEAVALMEANLGEPLPTEEISRLVGVSRRQLERLFKQHLDALPSRWYLELRLQQARRLLRESNLSILQIALSCGFASGPHFSNAYRSCFGHTPRDERSQRAAAWRAEATQAPAMPSTPADQESP